MSVMTGTVDETALIVALRDLPGFRLCPAECRRPRPRCMPT